MNAAARKYYNDRWSTDKWAGVGDYFELHYPGQLGFRVSESPIFLTESFVDKIIESCHTIVDQLISIPKEEYLMRVPEFCRVPNCPEKPQMLCIDFGICQDDDGHISHKLIELQAFPSLFFYQFELAKQYSTHCDMPSNKGFLFSGLTTETYVHEMYNLIVGNYSPREVVLMDIHPHTQKTRIDFVLTAKYLGINIVCATEVYAKNNHLYYQKDGEEIRIRRVYNRVILDELHRNTDITLKFSFNEAIDVEWITHPEWFYRISKNTMPFLKDNSVPECYFLHQRPADIKLSEFVLKPLYSFSGLGINIRPTQADIDAISDPENYIVQRKVNYASIFEDLNGETAKAELRILMIWPNHADKPFPVINLVRMTKSEMINVDHNKANLCFTGSSVAIIV